MKCSKYLMLATLLASLSFSSCDLERLPLTTALSFKLR